MCEPGKKTKGLKTRKQGKKEGVKQNERIESEEKKRAVKTKINSESKTNKRSNVTTQERREMKQKETNNNE